MKVRLKDLELAIEHIKKRYVGEVVDITYSDDEIGVLIGFNDKDKSLSNIKLFEYCINATPEVSSTKKLYKD